jgi:DUF4097 and DUF4098 domain-containing protein YvlB
MNLFTSARLLAAAGIFATALAARASDETAERTLKGEIAATTRAVVIDHRNGPVTIVGVDANFGWSWNLAVKSADGAAAQSYVKDAELELKETAGTLELRLILPNAREGSRSTHSSIFGIFSWSRYSGFGVTSRLELRLPRAVAAQVQNRFGPTHIEGISGTVDADCQNGRLELEHLKGAVVAKTSFAPLRAADLRTATLRNQNGAIEANSVDGDLRASTSFARLVLRNAKGRVELKNQNGGIDVADVEGDAVAATSFGSLSATNISGSADLRNQNGAIVAERVTGNLAAATSFSEIRVTDIGGKTSLQAQNGRIEATRVGDDLRAANSFGAMHVKDVRGTADLESQNGGIAAADMAGDIRAKASFGRIELDGTGRRFDARSQNGGVKITARSRDVERIAASSSFAPIDVRLPADLQPVVRANTSFGKVRSDFPVLLADANDTRFFESTGHPRIDLRGQNGDIHIESLAVR